MGLLPGAGGTQRLPRLVGVETAMPILLNGGRLSGEAAVRAGLAHVVIAKPGENIAANRKIGCFGAFAGAALEGDDRVALRPPSDAPRWRG